MHTPTAMGMISSGGGSGGGSNAKGGGVLSFGHRKKDTYSYFGKEQMVIIGNNNI